MNKLFVSILILFFINGPFITTINYTSASSELVTDSWNARASMGQARYDLGVIAVEGKIYAIGGYTSELYDGYSNFCVTTNECYDPVTDTWTTLAPTPTYRASFAIAAYQDKIYCIGGASSNGLCGTNDVYDITTDSWSTKTAMPFNDVFLKAHVIDGKIFVITSYDLFMYNPSTDSWTTKARMPQPLITSVHSAVVDNKIVVTYIPLRGSELHTYVIIYDPKTDAWREGAEADFLLCYGAASATTGIYAPKRVYVQGIMTPGITNFDALPTNHVYDPEKNTWLTAKAMPTARTHFGMAVVDDVLYVIGGILDISWENMPKRTPTTGPDGELIYIHLPSQPFIPTAVNEQYVPIGYSSIPLTSEPASKNYTTYITVTILALTVGVIIFGLLFLKKKRKNNLL
ncbi:MAG: hypothetical protein LBB87_04670 [Nitrososphaerota archaeon]|jgi:N-acetylneuraminic acid mutarotase|nr:hypothetical protein [Nitrososphaerota archaeon]